MTSSAPIYHRLLKLAVVVFLASSAFAQAPPERTRSSCGSEVQGNGRRVKDGSSHRRQARRLPRIAEERFGCHGDFSLSQEISRRHAAWAWISSANDEIEVTGSKIKQDGADLTLAREVVKGGDTLTLRFKDGKPAW